MIDFLKLVLYKLIYLLVKRIPATSRPKHLLLVKTDEIGDYVLLRNLLPLFRQSERFRDYTITLAGNEVFREIFEACDAGTADRVIWINKKKFRSKLRYRYQVLKQIRQSGASVAVNLVYSRLFRFDDGIVGVSTATERFGMAHDDRHTPAAERWLTPSGVYTQLIDGGEDHLFDACRNARFIGQLLQLPGTPSASTRLAVAEDIKLPGLPAGFFVVFPGSGIPAKKWPPAAFAAVARHVKKTYGLEPVVCGGPGDREAADGFVAAYGDPIIDLTGKTSLLQFMAVLRGSRFLVSVDTGSVHLAAAVGCPVFALFSGLHYGRFAPYPAEIAPHFFPVYPDYIDKIRATPGSYDFYTVPIGALKDIPVDKLVDAIDKNLPDLLH
ncbi:MAG: glycosyltransferase family 9 protein [Bacteroidetes bacterium]|nr:glycosyltransferase family 9 protein [Bacteroidota bacterium]